MPIMPICSLAARVVPCRASSVTFSLFRRLHFLTQLLNLPSQLRELQNPSTQNSRTVRNLAVVTH